MNIETVCPLTKEQIMARERFREAVVRGGMDVVYYSKLCAMALACIMLTEERDIPDDPLELLRMIEDWGR